jgi:hypothetical protein
MGRGNAPIIITTITIVVISISPSSVAVVRVKLNRCSSVPCIARVLLCVVAGEASVQHGSR